MLSSSASAPSPRIRAVFGIPLVLMIGGGVLVFNRIAKEPPRSLQTPTITPLDTADVTPALQDLRGQITAQGVKVFSFESNEWLSETGGGVPIETAGYTFKLLSSIAPGITAGFPDQPIMQTQSNMDAIFKNEGFSLAPTTNAGIQYKKNDISCTLAIQKQLRLYEDGSVNTAKIQCFTPSLLHAYASQAKPFVNAFMTATGTASEQVTIGPIAVLNPDDPHSGAIGPSRTAGYGIAKAVIPYSKGTLALFYSKAGVWHYVTSAGDEVGFRCKNIENNPEARKALAGQTCYDESPADNPAGQVAQRKVQP